MSAFATEEKWRALAETLDFAFQPIVNVHTGACQGYEALLRGWDRAGFSSIHAVFDAAHDELALYRFDLCLREKAIDKFASIPRHPRTRLYYNIDNRVLEMPDYAPGNTAAILARHGMTAESLCFEISERYEFKDYTQTRNVLTLYKHQSYMIALDDYGAGFSGLQLLYHCEPDIIKIDRFFIGGIEGDVKKRLFVSNVIKMAHLLGITVIGEGVETEQEFRACREIGCDLIQGYLIQRPTTDIAELMPLYPVVGVMNGIDRRRPHTDQRILFDWIDRVEPVALSASMSEVCRRFKEAKERTILPVVNGVSEPVGVIREADIKDLTYSRYGFALLMNPAVGASLRDYVTPCPVAEASTSVEGILETFAHGAQTDGILVAVDGRYEGFLSAADLIRAMNEKNVQIARDQNPLSRLPGNSRIHEYLGRALSDTGSEYAFAYFDFDSFKVFNDTYGFRLGDRVIVMFAEVLQHVLGLGGHFVGHVGGDDFFAGFVLGGASRLEDAQSLVRTVVERFNRDVTHFYGRDDRERGWIDGFDRDAAPRRYPLLTVSAAIVHLPRVGPTCSLEDLGSAIAHAKTLAKRAPDHVYRGSMECSDDGAVGARAHVWSGAGVSEVAGSAEGLALRPPRRVSLRLIE